MSRVGPKLVNSDYKCLPKYIGFQQEKGFLMVLKICLQFHVTVSLQALDGHKSSADSGSRRDSSSDIFVGSSKEGLLSFRQFSTDKNKVGL